MVLSGQQRDRWEMACGLYLHPPSPTLHRRDWPSAAGLLLFDDPAGGLHAMDGLRHSRRGRLLSLPATYAATHSAVFFAMFPGGVRVLQHLRYQARLISPAADARVGFTGRQLHRRSDGRSIGERTLSMVGPILLRRSGYPRRSAAYRRMDCSEGNLLDRPAGRARFAYRWSCYGYFNSKTPASAGGHRRSIAHGRAYGIRLALDPAIRESI